MSEVDIISKSTQQPFGDHSSPVRVDAARCHTCVFGFDNHSDTTRLQCFLNRSRDVVREALLNLQPPSERFYNTH